MRTDRNALARYCDAWSRWQNAAAFLDKHGDAYPIKGTDGTLKYMQQFPQVSIYHKLAAVLLRLEQEFGMTPSARTAIVVKPDEADDDFTRWLKETKRG